MAEKPPLGTIPYNIKAQSRIKDLAETIVRYAYEPGKHATSCIKIWAEEIVKQCELIEGLRESDEYYPHT